MFGGGCWRALPNNSKRLFRHHVEVLVRWSLAHGRWHCQSRWKISFKLCVYLYTQTKYYRYCQVISPVSAYDIFGHSYYYFCPPSSFLCISASRSLFKSTVFPLSPSDHVYLAIPLPITPPLSPPNGPFLLSWFLQLFLVTPSLLKIWSQEPQMREHALLFFLSLGPFTYSSLIQFHSPADLHFSD